MCDEDTDGPSFDVEDWHNYDKHIVELLPQETELIAYCFPNTQVMFATKLPLGALAIAKGQLRVLEPYLAKHCLHVGAENGTVMAVPGVTSAKNQAAAASAVNRFKGILRSHPEKGITV
jgi:hypothetical protein